MSGAGSSDADGDALEFAWSFGDGNSGTGVTTSHTYASAGTFTVRLIVTDTRGIADTTSTTATVLTPSQGVQNAIALVDQLVSSGKISGAIGASLTSKLNNAKKQLDRNQPADAVQPLQSVLDQLNGLVRSGNLTDSDAAPLRTLVTRIIDSIT
jgi:PKD repeat protein